MARFVKGDIVVVPFPFSSSSDVKRRPALVVASWPYEISEDYLLCLITSQAVHDLHCIELDASDITGGSLNRKSYVRPVYLFASAEALISRKIGMLNTEVLKKITDTIVNVVQ